MNQEELKALVAQMLREHTAAPEPPVKAGDGSVLL